MTTQNHYAKPENALKRSDRLINVGQKQDPLKALHDLVTSERYMAGWQKSVLEKIMLKCVELCVELKKCRFAKDGLIQQVMDISSLEEVIKLFLLLFTVKEEISDFFTPSGQRIRRERPVKQFAKKVKDMQWKLATGGCGNRGGRGRRGGRG